jgi:hypothetical protein
MVFTSKFVGTGPSSYTKEFTGPRSQSLRNTGLEGWVVPQPGWMFCKDTTLSLLGFEPQIVQPVAQSVYKLYCPGCHYFYGEI